MRSVPPAVIQFARLSVYLLYSLEAGIVLLLVPWTDLWTRNVLLVDRPGLELMLTPLGRGLVSGVGAALVLNAFFDIGAVLFGPPRRGRS